MAAGPGAAEQPQLPPESEDGVLAMILGLLGWLVVGVWAGFAAARGSSPWLAWVSVVAVLLGLGIGAFVWRRHQVYQAHRAAAAAAAGGRPGGPVAGRGAV